MKRLILPFLLILSIGVNIGLLFGGRAPTQVPKSDPLTLGGEEPGGERAFPPRLKRMVHRMASELSLEGPERERFLQLQRRFFSRSIESRERAIRAQRAMRRELLGPEPDRERVTELLHATTEAQKAIEEEFLTNYFATRDLLSSPDQLKLFHRFMIRVRRARQEMERRLGQGGENRRFERRLQEGPKEGLRQRPWQRKRPSEPRGEEDSETDSPG